jgi:phage recombination protein Bet
MTDALVVWTQEQKELIKKTVATDATDAELAMFLHIAAKAGLDPLQKQIHFTKRQGRVTVIAGIDGLQARAAREADFEGILAGVVCQKDDFEFDATTGKVTKHAYNAFGDRGPIKGAWATVHRKGKLPFTAVVRFEEFNQPQSPTWKQMPSVMIQKVAKSTALRQAYPEQFGGIYERAEMDQAGAPDTEKDVSPPKSGGDAVRAALANVKATGYGSPVVLEQLEEHVNALPPPSSSETANALKASVVLYRKQPIDKLTYDELAAGVEELRAWLANPKNDRNPGRQQTEARLAAMVAEASYRETDALTSDTESTDVGGAA